MFLKDLWTTQSKVQKTKLRQTKTLQKNGVFFVFYKNRNNFNKNADFKYKKGAFFENFAKNIKLGIDFWLNLL